VKRARPAQVLILGGGFAGISAAMELSRKKTAGEVDVHLVNNENYFVFQPLLPEVISCSIEPSHVINPIRQLCKDIHFHYGTVTHIHLRNQTVTVAGPDGKQSHILLFDHLIWALGLIVDLSRIPGMAEHACPLKTLGDAFHLRNRILTRLEEADQEIDEDARRAALTFVVVGGGFSGVEVAGGINDLIKSVLRYYPRARQTGYRVVLAHAGERILNELDASLAGFAEEKLKSRHIEVLLNTTVVEATPGALIFADGASVSAGTIVCTVGNAPNPLVPETALPNRHGRIFADGYLHVQGFERLWAIGDGALVPHPYRDGFCPPTAQYAIRQGTACARNVLAQIREGSLQPFRFGGIGQLALIGRRCGVAQLFGWKISGAVAWFLWRSIYWSKIPGIRTKLRVAIDWAMDALFPRDITMVETQRTSQLRRAHYRAGDVVFRQGEVGDRFFIIVSGEVEIFREEPGHPPQRLGTRSQGESFGELALLKQVPRTATVRCVTPVDVMTMTRVDFLRLVSTHGAMRKLMEDQMSVLAYSDKGS